MTLLRLTDAEIERLDPYAFMAVVGKRVIHPGGRRSTEEIFRLGEFSSGQRVLEVGCGVGTTAIELTQRFGCSVTAIDIDPMMVERASEAVLAAGVGDRVAVERADVCALPYPDDAFDRVVVEAVTMFVDRERAARELVRVCRFGGRVLEHEFIYLRPPRPEARRVFEGEVCPGIAVTSSQDWATLYHAAGLEDLHLVVGPFSMMTPTGMLRDEGLGNLLRIMAHVAQRPAYVRKMTWLMKRLLPIRSDLGYVVLIGSKPARIGS